MAEMLAIQLKKKYLTKQYILSALPRFARNWELSESNARSIVKTVSWRITGSGATFLISYLISNNLSMAGTIAVIQLTANTLLYYLHERVWNKTKWGKLD